MRVTRYLDPLVLPLVGALTLLMFSWPFFIAPGENRASSISSTAGLAQLVFVFVMPALVAAVIAYTARAGLNGTGLDARQIALLGALVGMNAVARLLGAGTAGLETVFFLILIGGYALGPAFGYLLGAGSLFVSAMLGGGVGPWLPYQIMAAGLLGLLAGKLPKPSSMTARRLTLAGFAVPAAYLYGGLMTMWNWPFLAGSGGALGYEPGAGIVENLTRFIGFELATGGLLWDTGRALTTLVLVWLTAPTLLATLERAARRAGMTN